jgi:hypothetical protein
VFTGHAKTGGDQQRAELVTVQPGSVRLVIEPGTADMRGQRVIKQFFLDGVLVEPGDGAQPPGDGGPGAAAGLQVAGEALDVGAARLEQADVIWRRSNAYASRGRAEAREGWARRGPSDDDSPHRQPAQMITQGHHGDFGR